MTAKVSRIHRQSETLDASPVPPNPMDFFAELSRQQLALSMQGACAMFRGSQAIRHIQEQAAHQALEQHEKAVQKLRDSSDSADLMAVQSDLMRFDMAGAVQYWQQLGQAALKTQAEMMDCATRMLGAPQDNGMKSLMDKWQATMAASLTGPATWPTQSQ